MNPAISRKDLAKLFDHTQLKAFASDEDFIRLCQEADENGCCMVAINSAQTALCKRLLKNSPVHVGAAISFPLGQTSIAAKVFETQDAIQNGADEIDYVINISQLKNKNYEYIQDEMQQIVNICRQNHVISKVIFENCYLSEEEIIKLCEIAKEVGPDFIKTSTGFGTHGARVEQVRLMKQHVGDKVKVKAAGEIRDLDTCLAMIEAGAERIGTSSSLKILAEYDERFGK